MPANTTGEFWQRHGITKPLGASLAEPAIVALETSHEMFATAFDQAPLPKPTSEIALCALRNLSDRIYEQAVGMLVCLGTGPAAAAETVARTVIEGAFNLQFIVSQDLESRLFAFFHRYLREHGEKLDDWQREVMGRSPNPGHSFELKGIDDQRLVLQHLLKFVKELRSGLGLEQPEQLARYWPHSLFKRCKETRASTDYLTSYHRLSASSHLNAEETIRWLLGHALTDSDQNQSFMRNLAMETVSYSAMMTRISVVHYLEATAATCRALDAAFDQTQLSKILLDLRTSVESISMDAGCPDSGVD
jgi:exonuclease VII large subunit